MYKDHNNHHQLERILAETELEVGGKKPDLQPAASDFKLSLDW